MKKPKAVLIGDTRYFHIGSYVNCTYLSRIISEKYDFLGLFGDERFYFKDYSNFLEEISNWKVLHISIQDADFIFLNGEGYIEPNSPYAESLSYVARYVKEKWPDKKVHLINFSCFDEKYWDWTIFDKLVVRDKGSFECLKNTHPSVDLGFDCSILQNESISNLSQNKFILIFRGRRDIADSEIELIKNTFKDKDVRVVSSFWSFDHGEPIQTNSLADTQELFKNTYLVISSSFHGIIFSTCFGIPFIPIESINTNKNTSVAEDVLGDYYANRTINEWLEFYSNKENYDKIRNRLISIFSTLKDRARKYLF